MSSNSVAGPAYTKTGYLWREERGSPAEVYGELHCHVDHSNIICKKSKKVRLELRTSSEVQLLNLGLQEAKKTNDWALENGFNYTLPSGSIDQFVKYNATRYPLYTSREAKEPISFEHHVFIPASLSVHIDGEPYPIHVAHTEHEVDIINDHTVKFNPIAKKYLLTVVNIHLTVILDPKKHHVFLSLEVPKEAPLENMSLFEPVEIELQGESTILGVPVSNCSIL